MRFAPRQIRTHRAHIPTTVAPVPRLTRVMIAAAAIGAASIAVIALWSLAVVKATASSDFANSTGSAGVDCGSVWVHDWDNNFYCRPQLHTRREALGVAGGVGTGLAVFGGVGAAVLSRSHHRTRRLSPC